VKPGEVALAYLISIEPMLPTGTGTSNAEARADLRALITERELQARQIEALQWSERNEIEKVAALRAAISAALREGHAYLATTPESKRPSDRNVARIFVSKIVAALEGRD
jgi:hypothetical protein